DTESTPDHTKEKIRENIDLLKKKLKHPIVATDASLYDALKKKVDALNLSKLTDSERSGDEAEAYFFGVNWEHIEKKPDVMGLVEHEEKINEILYVECSRILCTKQKKADDSMKLWREMLDGSCFVGAACRPMANHLALGDTTLFSSGPRRNSIDAKHTTICKLSCIFIVDSAGKAFQIYQMHKNILIVNKSLLMQTLERADLLPLWNVQQSPIVSSPHDLLRELNSRLIAKIDKLRRENVNTKAKNTRLKQAIEENAKREAEYEIRIKKLEQSNKENINLKDNPEENSSKQIDLQCDKTPVYNIVDNTSNFDEFNDALDSNISDNTFSKTKPYKNKEIKFLKRVHKEHISNKIRERNQKKLRSQDPILKPSNLSYNDQNLKKAESRNCVFSEQNTDTQEIKESEIDIQPLIQ
ncbi:33770_t:CDS:2, partial [Gigaspora margarita]